MESHHISNGQLSVKKVYKLCKDKTTLALSQESHDQIVNCRNFMEKYLKENERPVYGINTGFGSLCNIRISGEELNQLQENLVRSHACGTGETAPEEIVRLMLFLKVASLSYGYSGVKLQTVERLMDLYNQNLLPVVYEQGSLGASGDLAPLAHLSLPLLGEGELWQNGKKVQAADILQQKNLQALNLGAKEGIALLNGTQFMSAYGVYCTYHALRLLQLADLMAATSVDAFLCRNEPFHEGLHRIRPHAGQVQAAENIRHILRDSEMFHLNKEQVQDPYSFRCIPQVHGASRAAVAHVQQVLETEINSVTDNPNILADEGEILSGGNFHGQPLALTLDYLAIALSELASISERRTYQLISGQRGLPAFLVAKPGLNSGLMIPQYTAASIVSQNKQLCTPASTDTIPSSNGQEDHVSMGANAATKLLRVVQNVYKVFGIELLTASQAMSFRKNMRSSAAVEGLLQQYQEIVPVVKDDRVLHYDIENSRRFLEELEVGE